MVKPAREPRKVQFQDFFDFGLSRSCQKMESLVRGNDPGRPPQALSPSGLRGPGPGGPQENSAYLSGLDSNANNGNSPRSPSSRPTTDDEYDYQMNNISLLKAQLKVRYCFVGQNMKPGRKFHTFS